MLKINRIAMVFLNLILVSLLCGFIIVNTAYAKAVNEVIDVQSKQLDLEKRQYFRYAPSGQKVYLGLVRNEFVVQYQEGTTQGQIERLNAKYQTQILKTFRKEERAGGKAIAPIYLLRIPPGKYLKDMLKPYSRETREISNVYGYDSIVEWTMPAFHILNARVIPTDEFKVMLSPNASESNLTELNQAHRVEIVARNKDGSYQLRVTSQSDLHSLDMANAYHEQPFIAWAVPDYLSNQEADEPEERVYFNLHEIGPTEYFPVNLDEFAVQFKPGVTDAQIDALNAKYHTQIIEKIRQGIHGEPIYTFSLPPGKRLKDVLKLYGKQQTPRPGVYGYEPIVEWTMPTFSYIGKRVTPTAEFTVRLKPGVDEAVLREFNRKHGVEEVGRRSTYSPILGDTITIYYLKVTEKSDLNSPDMSNLYELQPFIKWAEPDYYHPAFDSLPPDYPNDTLYVSGSQWNLNQGSDIDIDAPEAWRIWNNESDGKGSGITIAFVDNGIEGNHEDFDGTVI